MAGDDNVLPMTPRDRRKPAGRPSSRARKTPSSRPAALPPPPPFAALDDEQAAADSAFAEFDLAAYPDYERIDTSDLHSYMDGEALRAPGVSLAVRLVRAVMASVRAMRRAHAWATRHSTLVWIVSGLLVAAGIGALVDWELRTSGIEARYVAGMAPKLGYHVEAGPSTSIRFPHDGGPYDSELGYSLIPELTDRLAGEGYDVEAQARLSPLHRQLIDHGLYPIYQEKATHGLTVLGDRDGVLYEESYPKASFDGLANVPKLIVASLLFIEDRQVLDRRSATLNPAISWDRLTKATIELVLDKLFRARNVPGGSTLATQIEKFRHSAEGRTRGASDKLRQMASATARSYLLGQDTRATREQIVLDYINGVPLGSVPGLGQVTGLGEGLKAWYGADLLAVASALDARPAADDQDARDAQAVAFKRVLALFLAQRRPAFYLQRNQAALAKLTDTYIRAMGKAGAIPARLAHDALKQRLGLMAVGVARPAPMQTSFIERKAANAVRVEVESLLGLDSLYALDRLDLEVHSSFDKDLQGQVAEFLLGLQTPEGAKAAGIVGERMLTAEQAQDVSYSFTLVERQDDKNVVRVQTDTVDGPLDLNRGGKLELGSTAKLRTLLTYLQLVAEDYARLAPHADDDDWMAGELARTSDEDELGRWLVTYLRESGSDATLEDTLRAAVDRPFSASPYQNFMTGGGVMHFQNFEPEDNGSHFSVAQAFQRSNNLVFVRVMREIVQHVIFTRIDSARELLADPEHPARRAYVDRFVDLESTAFLRRFYRELKPLTPGQRLERLALSKHLTTSRLAALLLTIRPDLDWYAFHLSMTVQFPDCPEKALERYWQTLRPDVMSLADRGYTARVHPLELWLAAYLRQHPGALFKDALAASHDARFDSYQWLYKKAGPKRQEKYVRTMLERDAFNVYIIKYWKDQGFPFDWLTPTYASALGSSGDRPSALADLIGAVFNDGVMVPTRRIEELRFGKSTPFETTFTPAWEGARRVVAPEVAAIAREALTSVVEGGTARRLKDSLKRDDGTSVPIAAKTGTGDNRLETFGPGGRIMKSEKKSRTATLVFAIGDRFYGTITAYVKADGDADDSVNGFSFTSSLVVQALKALMPTLKPTVLKVEDPLGSYALNWPIPPSIVGAEFAHADVHDAMIAHQ